jgi:hypothetical protein
MLSVSEFCLLFWVKIPAVVLLVAFSFAVVADKTRFVELGLLRLRLLGPRSLSIGIECRSST